MKSYRLSSVIQAGLLGLVVGGAAGFLTGIVVAPEKGQMMRRRLAFRLDRLSEKVTAYVDQVLSPQQVSDARRSGEELVEDARQRAQSIRDDIDALLGEIRRATPAADAPEVQDR